MLCTRERVLLTLLLPVVVKTKSGATAAVSEGSNYDAVIRMVLYDVAGVLLYAAGNSLAGRYCCRKRGGPGGGGGVPETRETFKRRCTRNEQFADCSTQKTGDESGCRFSPFHLLAGRGFAGKYIALSYDTDYHPAVD